jgi:hypothetical protein
MREQINRDEYCSCVAGEILAMQSSMSLLVEERAKLGDREPILVSYAYVPRRAPAQKPVRVVKRHLVPAENRAR